MLNKSNLSNGQNDLVTRLYETDCTLVYASMGAGKSVATLTAIQELINDGELKKVLIVAPLKVCTEVWSAEHLKWHHLWGLRINIAVGSPVKRKRALESDCDICVINIENLAWFCDEYKGDHTFDGLVLDELSKFKDNGAKVVKKLRYRVQDFTWRVGLTGTPVHEGFDCLFSQMLVLDGGVRLGKNKQKFLLAHFYATDWEQRNWELRTGEEKKLLARIADVLYAMPDYTSELPELVEKRIDFRLGLLAQLDYNDFKKHSVYTCADGWPIIADNAAVLSGKLEQFASGFLYCDDVDGGVEHLHTARLDALRVYLSMDENVDENILIFYNFTEDKNRIISHLGRSAVLLSPDAINDWNDGKIKYLLAHSKSAGHGLNLQHGGCRVLWYTPQWSNDVFKQSNARLWRRGQVNKVIVTTLVAVDTVNELTVDRIADKDDYDILFKQHCEK